MLLLPMLALWNDVTADTIGTTAGWTSKVELADVDGDGFVDIFFANGGDYDTPGTPEAQKVFHNLGNWSAAPPHFEDWSATVFGAAGTRLSRVIKVRDVDGDGDQDVFVGGSYQTASGLFVQGPIGTFTDASAAKLPAQVVSAGDAEFGDVDGDGDLDLAIADWGPDAQNGGGPVRLWLNDGDGGFTAADARVPADSIGMSWDLELVDIDDNGDLDILVSCKRCAGGFAYVNDGEGNFAKDSARLPQRANNYEYEPMDIDGDGDLDLVTINDGSNFTETVLINDGHGTFADETSSRLSGANNVAGADDNVDTFLDVDSDGDPDWIIGSLSDADRLLVNDGDGNFTLDDTVMTLSTPGTLGLAVADLDGDHRLDVVQSQGEVTSPDKVLLANTGVIADGRVPDVRVLHGADASDAIVVARALDGKSPSMVHDWTRIELAITSPGTHAPIAMEWRGEYLWAAELTGAVEGDTYQVCAVDAAGNQGCSDTVTFGASPDGGPGGDDTGGKDGCCSTSGSRGAGGSLLLALATLIAARRSRRARRGS